MMKRFQAHLLKRRFCLCANVLGFLESLFPYLLYTSQMARNPGWHPKVDRISQLFCLAFMSTGLEPLLEPSEKKSQGVKGRPERNSLLVRLVCMTRQALQILGPGWAGWNSLPFNQFFVLFHSEVKEWDTYCLFSSQLERVFITGKHLQLRLGALNDLYQNRFGASGTMWKVARFQDSSQTPSEEFWKKTL